MVDLQIYREAFGNELELEHVFEMFLGSLLKSTITYDYFVDWKKVRRNVKKYRNELNILSQLRSSQDFEKDFEILVQKNPKVVSVIPLLIAVRNKEKFLILETKVQLDYQM